MGGGSIALLLTLQEILAGKQANADCRETCFAARAPMIPLADGVSRQAGV
ncbi:MAG TPA: hypothetical protein VF450_20360 [Noviherbaspirillum sp.]